jgi:hypothetical protein
MEGSGSAWEWHGGDGNVCGCCRAVRMVEDGAATRLRLFALGTDVQGQVDGSDRWLSRVQAVSGRWRLTGNASEGTVRTQRTQ